MPPRAVPFALLLSSLASCALASRDLSADGGRADARSRSDAGSSSDLVDAATESPDATSSGTPDAALVFDAAPTPDAAPILESLLISEIVDADLAGGLPKFVELTNLGTSSVDLSEFSLGVFSNGSFTLNSGASKVLSGALAPSASFVVSFENGDAVGASSFRTVYGVDADNLDFGAIINGNDAIVLYRGLATGTGADATTVDSYGVRGTDGVGEAWEYTDGFATRRQAATTPSAAFTASDWGFSGPGALASVDATGILAATSPGTH